MRRTPTILGACALAAAGLAAGVATNDLAADPGPPNQGDPDKVLTVASGYVCTGTLVPGEKLGDNAGLGPTITVTASTPIVQVTIKSGSKADLVSATWAPGFLSGTITITQDVSNYVVWTCAGGTTTTTTTGTTTTTTTTTTATTETTPTTTETTPARTTPAATTTEEETAPATTPLVPLRPPVAPAAETTPTPEQAAPAATPASGGVAGVATPALAYTP